MGCSTVNFTLTLIRLCLQNLYKFYSYCLLQVLLPQVLLPQVLLPHNSALSLIFMYLSGSVMHCSLAMPALSFFGLLFMYCLNGNLWVHFLWSTPAPFLANNRTQWRVLALRDIECELCFTGRWRWPLGLSGWWILWAGRLGFMGLRLWESGCPRCLCQSIIFHRVDQPNHQCEQPVGHDHGDSNLKYFLLVRQTWIYTDKIYAQNVCWLEALEIIVQCVHSARGYVRLYGSWAWGFLPWSQCQICTWSWPTSHPDSLSW